MNELRLECLKLAVNAAMMNGSNAVELADYFWRFVNTGDTRLPTKKGEAE